MNKTVYQGRGAVNCAVGLFVKVSVRLCPALTTFTQDDLGVGEWERARGRDGHGLGGS